MRLLAWTVGIAVGLFFVAAALVFLEGTGGHDGWLCEWGIDIDGEETVVSGCG